jgi:hypothetical protein
MVFFMLVFNGHSHESSTQSENKDRFAFIVPRYWQPEAFRVYPTGKIDSLKLPPFGGGGIGRLGFGDTQQLPSPNYMLLAYIDSTRNLALYNVSTGQSKQITSVAQPQDDVFAAIAVLITCWSKDSQKLLYYVSPGDTECDDCDREGWEMRPAAYGFYIYDLKSAQPVMTKLPAEFQDWINGEEMLLAGPYNGTVTLYRFSPFNNHSSAITAVPGSIGQIEVSQDGHWLTAVLSTGISKDPRPSRIVKIDLSSGELAYLTSPGAFTEYQWPRFSPNGKRIAYVQNEYARDIVIMVNGEKIFAPELNCFPRICWIDDTNIAVFCKNGLVVMDIEAKTQKVRLRF